MTRQKVRLTTTWALAIAVTAISASRVSAQDYCSSPGTTCYTPPAAAVIVGSGPENAIDVDALFYGELQTLEVRSAIASLAGASGYAESTKNHYVVKAFTNGAKDLFGGRRSASAFATYIFIPHDAQNRPDIMVDLKLKMSASASMGAGGSYGVVVCGIGEPGYVGSNASGPNYFEPPRCGLLVPYSYVAGTGNGLWWRMLSKFSQLYYSITGNGYYVEDNLDTGVHVIPELPYLITVFATSGTDLAVGGGGLATVDPVIEAAAVNPDVTIEFPNLADNPNPQPLLGDLTPAALEAMGINPQPFVDLGFFDPPSQDPPSSEPPPPSPSKAWCGPGFWLYNAVKFSARAWKVGTDDDYNATAGQRTACPVAAGNPTLLRVLQNPKLYFSRELQGIGFNCVADHLSGKSGLLGTAADNNAACSIDQFGRQIP